MHQEPYVTFYLPCKSLNFCILKKLIYTSQKGYSKKNIFCLSIIKYQFKINVYLITTMQYP